MTQTIASSPASTSSPWPARRWIIIAAGLLITHATLMITAVVIASSGNTFVPIPGYYKKALDWDTSQAARAAATAAGLTLSITPGQTTDGGAGRLVSIALSPGQADRINVRYFHHARAGQVSTATIASGATVTVDRPGFWQFEVSATVNGQPVLLEDTLFIPG
jgi:hypothetical protein